jgi:hypothetical protein
MAPGGPFMPENDTSKMKQADSLQPPFAGSAFRPAVEVASRFGGMGCEIYSTDNGQPSTDTIELLAAVAEFVASQIQHQGRPALIALGQFEGLVKIGFFNSFDKGGKVDP